MKLQTIKFKKGLVLLALACLIAVPASAMAQIAVTFETGAPPATLFGESNFLPGDTVERWADITNETAESLPVGMVVTNFSDPNGLGSQIDFIITQDANELFNGTLSEFVALGEFTLDPALPANSTERFDFNAIFKPGAGNPYQQAQVVFDLVFGIVTNEPVDQIPSGLGGAPTLQSGSSSGSAGQSGSISGVLFNDENSSGTQDAGEQGLGGWIVYLDANGNNLLDAGENNVVTSPDGTYGFVNLPPGTYTVRTVLQEGWSFVVPAEAAEFEYVVGIVSGAVTDRNFGVLQGQVAGISDAVSFDDSGNLTNEQGEVLQAVDSLPKTGIDVKLLFFLLPCLLITMVLGVKNRYEFLISNY